MNVKLTPEQERIVTDELKSGHFRTAEEVIAKALDALREKEHLSTGINVDSVNSAQGQAVEEMFAFIEKNHTRLDGISVKDLIREGHRL